MATYTVTIMGDLVDSTAGLRGLLEALALTDAGAAAGGTQS